MTFRYYILIMSAATLMLMGCGGSNDGLIDEPQNVAESPAPKEITIKTDVWKMMEGSRATTFDDLASLQTEGSFTCEAYAAGTLSSYISTTTADWNGSTQWQFNNGDSHYYWPLPTYNGGEWPSLDFFGYMPNEDSKPSYITSGPTYSIVSSNPQATFTCASMPMTYHKDTPTEGQGSSLKEFIWGITVGQNKPNQGVSGVTMKFRHPFARIRFQLSASHPDIQINSITFKKLKTGGTCTLNATDIADDYYYTNSVWSSLTGNSNLVMTLASKDGGGDWVAADVNTFNDNPASVVPIGGYSGGVHQYVDLLVIPQTFGGVIEVDATWTDKAGLNQILTTTISSVTWQSGYSYTYTFTISPNDLVVNTDKFTEQW